MSLTSSDEEIAARTDRLGLDATVSVQRLRRLYGVGKVAGSGSAIAISYQVAVAKAGAVFTHIVGSPMQGNIAPGRPD